MNSLLQKARDIFFYCGLSKEEYRKIKKEAYISNFRVWKLLNVLICVYFAILLVIAITDSTLMDISRILLLVYFVFISLVFFFVLREDSLIAQFAIYLSMVVLLLGGLRLGLNRPDQMAVSFVVFLVLLPMFMIDKPYYMGLVLSIASAVYLLAAAPVKTPFAFKGDLVNVIVYCILGIIINTFYNNLRIKEIQQSLKESENLLTLRQANEKTQKLNKTLEKMSESVIDLLGDVVESRDVESGKHIARVKGYSYILANQVMQDLPEYGLNKYTVGLIASASALHDVGKITVPDRILLKPGKLTPEEFEIMKNHCRSGCDILRKMSGSWTQDYLEMGLSICMSHHEKWDGRGYPNGLKGDEIPIAAQIVSVADIYDALTSERTYKKAYSNEQAFRMILTGECGAFSDKLMTCFARCREKFEAHAATPTDLNISRQYEITVLNRSGNESFVVGLHDEDRTLQEKNRLGERASVFGSLSDNYCYICYVDMRKNEVYRFMADENFSRILDSYGEELRSNERFDRLMNSIIVSEDFPAFLASVSREKAIAEIFANGFLTTDFRIRLEDGVHYCRMRITPAENRSDTMLLGISLRDEEHRQEEEKLRLQEELAKARQEAESRQTLEDQLAVINTISGEYDYVCSLDINTMDVTVYRAVDWIRDMFKNIEDIVKSSEVRNTTLKGIIHPQDYDSFCRASRHENVLHGLAEGNGEYVVTYRAYKYGKQVNYQTRYAVDKNNPRRIIIGLHEV